MKKIVSLKHARAKLLGYDTHAAYVLERRMAKNVKRVYQLMDELYDYCYSKAVKEIDSLKSFLASLQIL